MTRPPEPPTEREIARAARAGGSTVGRRLALALAAGVGLGFALGPRNAREPGSAGADRIETADGQPTPDVRRRLEALSAVPAADLVGLAAAVQAREARIADLRADAAARVTLGTAGGLPADWAVVYLHGFSASRQETAPLAEQVAGHLGAHRFEARLTGHGRTGAAMAESSVAAWQADAHEALAIGRRMARRVLVIGVSTGATLAAWLALQPAAARDTAWVLVSPNFQPAHPLAGVINWPWGRTITRWVNGPEHGFTPVNAEHARHWTTRYPTEALFPMMALVDAASRWPLDRLLAPVLMLLAPGDQVIDPAAARAAFGRIGSPRKQLVEVTDSTDPSQHVLAGRILSPSSTAPLARTIADWAASTVPRGTGT